MEDKNGRRPFFWKRIGTVCMIAGILMGMTPFLKETKEDMRQKEILEEWNTVFQSMERSEGSTAEGKEQVLKAAAEQKGTKGILKIPSIDLEQPVLEGAAEEHLSISLATIEPTGEPGGTGNFAVAGHNSRTYGRHFNRLGEVAEGDEIIFETGNERITYQVTGSFVVNADEVWVLEDTLEGSEITLVTCYYPKDGETQRLVVKGLRKE